MPDAINFQALGKQIKEGIDYRIRRRDGSSGILLMAPHGGRIEFGTTEIADAVAGNRHAFYTFSGIRKQGNRSLHITSHLFDEPCGIEMVLRATTVMTIHGCKHTLPAVYTGGRHLQLRRHIETALTAAGFRVEPNSALPGKHRFNICNRGRLRMGVQLEITAGLRRTLFVDLTQNRSKRKTADFGKFVAALQDGIDTCLDRRHADKKRSKEKMNP